MEENWRVRLEELSFDSHERRGVTRTGSRVSLYRVSFSWLPAALLRSGNAIASVRPFVHLSVRPFVLPSVSTLTFDPSDL